MSDRKIADSEIKSAQGYDQRTHQNFLLDVRGADSMSTSIMKSWGEWIQVTVASVSFLIMLRVYVNFGVTLDASTLNVNIPQWLNQTTAKSI